MQAYGLHTGFLWPLANEICVRISTSLSLPFAPDSYVDSILSVIGHLRHA